MSSVSGKEQDSQYKIQQLEKTLITLYPNVNGQIKADRKLINMRDTKRIKHEDGFYMITLNLSMNECHAVMIYKETELDGKIKFYIYDPNGKSSARKYNYQTNIVSNNSFEIDFSMTPDKSINEDGTCALWCIVVIILWNSFIPEDRWTALNLFNAKMRESYDVRKHFMDGILLLLRGDFSSESVTKQFIEEVRKRIRDLSIEF